MRFFYQARSKEGKVETGNVEASSKDAAASLLQKYNITVISLKEVKDTLKASRSSGFMNKISKKELAIFSRQLAVMLDSRVPVVQSMLSLAAQMEKEYFRQVLNKVAEMVEEGNTISDALSTMPKVFDVFYINLIKSGEASGKISEALYYLGDHLEREHDINSKIKGAMMYPILVLSVMLVVIVIIMTFVMPKLMEIISQVGGEPPLMTKILVGFYNFFVYYGWIVLIAFAGLVVYLGYYFKTKPGKKVYDKIILKIPFVGSFLGKSYLVRFAENLSTLISAGLPITTALKITKNTIGNFVYKSIAAETERKVSEGEKISTVLTTYPKEIPSFVVQMVKVGEETGKLDKTLMEIVNFYNKEITRLVDTFMTLIEPVLIVVLGAVVVMIAVSVLSPLYSMMGNI